MGREHRRHCEFPFSVKEAVRARANGLCEYPEGCDDYNDGTIDHFTGCLLGKLLGMDPAVIRSLDNAQTLCARHNFIKTEEENRYIDVLRAKQRHPRTRLAG